MAVYMSRGPPNGSVYVCNLPPGTDETMLAEYFGTIGLLKVWVLSGNIFCNHWQVRQDIFYAFSNSV